MARCPNVITWTHTVSVDQWNCLLFFFSPPCIDMRFVACSVMQCYVSQISRSVVTLYSCVWLISFYCSVQCRMYFWYMVDRVDLVKGCFAQLLSIKVMCYGELTQVWNSGFYLSGQRQEHEDSCPFAPVSSVFSCFRRFLLEAYGWMRRLMLAIGQ